MQYVYILELIDHSFYVGTTPRLEDRLKDHNEGKCKSTKDNRPVKLHWYCCFKDKSKALAFEKYLKGGSGTAFRHGGQGRREYKQAG
jgi:predicted GIY-YIG superfamily endonuclease